jgi:D,D-heptose 1,7-bisphosphate phosphatase
MNKAVFIDKDGTLIHDVPYNVDPSRVRLQDGAARSLRQLKDEGFLLILVSNQSGVAHGYFEEKDLDRIREKLQEQLATENAALDGFYFCPHHPDGTVQPYAIHCECRKPKAGLLINAAKDFDIDLSNSWMIGDILNDVEAGNTAGCTSILVDNGNETEWLLTNNRMPFRAVRNIDEAVSLILQKKPV